MTIKEEMNAIDLAQRLRICDALVSKSIENVKQAIKEKKKLTPKLENSSILISQIVDLQELVEKLRNTDFDNPAIKEISDKAIKIYEEQYYPKLKELNELYNEYNKLGIVKVPNLEERVGREIKEEIFKY